MLSGIELQHSRRTTKFKTHSRKMQSAQRSHRGLVLFLMFALFDRHLVELVQLFRIELSELRHEDPQVSAQNNFHR